MQQNQLAYQPTAHVPVTTTADSIIIPHKRQRKAAPFANESLAYGAASSLSLLIK